MDLLRGGERHTATRTSPPLPSPAGTRFFQDNSWGSVWRTVDMKGCQTTAFPEHLGLACAWVESMSHFNIDWHCLDLWHLFLLLLPILSLFSHIKTHIPIDLNSLWGNQNMWLKWFTAGVGVDQQDFTLTGITGHKGGLVTKTKSSWVKCVWRSSILSLEEWQLILNIFLLPCLPVPYIPSTYHKPAI